MTIVLAGSAGAAGWRSLRIDASSEASFNESVAKDVVKLTDPTGKKAKQYGTQYYYVRAGGGAGLPESPWPARSPPMVNDQYTRGATRAIDGNRGQ